jgi:hypothetical protein
MQNGGSFIFRYERNYPMNKLLKLAGRGALLCLLSALPAVAQITNAVSFTTTFPFYAGNTKLPPGSYKVSQSPMDITILMIEGGKGVHSAFIDYTPSQTEKLHPSTLVSFKKYGSTDFLDTIWVQGQRYGMVIDPTKAEKKMAAGGAPETHSVPAQ